MAKKIVTVIKKDVVLNIPVSGAFYLRIYDLVTRILDRQPNIKESLIRIEAVDKPLSIDEAVVQTLMMLMREVEDATTIDLENLTEPYEVTVPDDTEEAIDPS